MPSKKPVGLKSTLKQRVKLLLGVIAPGGGLAGAGQEGWVGAKVATIIGGFFIADPLSLRFRALVMLARIVELAVAAGMQIGVTLGAGIAGADSASGGILDLLAALPAVEKHSDE